MYIIGIKEKKEEHKNNYWKGLYCKNDICSIFMRQIMEDKKDTTV